MDITADHVRSCDYWLRRERMARELAAKAADWHIAEIHLDMAERYGALARSAVPDAKVR